MAARAARRRFGGDAALAQFMGEALPPVMEIGFARVEPRPVLALSRDGQMDMGVRGVGVQRHHIAELPLELDARKRLDGIMDSRGIGRTAGHRQDHRSEEHTSELQSLMRNSYDIFCLKKKNKQ